MKLTIQSYLTENKILKSKIQNLQNETLKSSMKADDGLSAYLIKTMSNESAVPPFMKFFSNKNILFHCTSKIRCCIL